MFSLFKKKERKSVKPKFTLHKYNSDLFIECCNFLIDNGFKQIGDYCFERPCKNYGRRIFFVYHIYLDLIVNIYYPQEPIRCISSKREMQELIDRFKKEYPKP